MKRLLTCLACLAGLAASEGFAATAHRHGHGTADLAVDGNRVTLEFEAPLHDLVGFEREPANDKERAAVQAVLEYLKSGRGFVPAAAAACTRQEGTAEVARESKDHAEFRARLVFRCESPQALKGLEAPLLRDYRKLRRVDLRVADGKRQAARRLTTEKPAASW